MRSGRYVAQVEGYKAFIPTPLPPSLQFDDELISLLSQADRALGRLDGAASILPNPDLFVAMYVRQEAVLSSQIEGTQASLADVLQFEIGEESSQPKDVEEIVNYVRTMNYGIKRLDELPLCLRLIKEIHAELIDGTRGENLEPGEFRRSQNWIGPAGCTLTRASYVPPPVHEMHEALSDLEKFLNADHALPPLLLCGLAHAQFETIHPFLDGNGRVGRLLITLLHCQRNILQRPLLYLSLFLKQNRTEYYDRLMAVRTKGHWEEWLKFFLQGVYEVSQQAFETAIAILDQRESDRDLISQSINQPTNALRVLEELFAHPITTIKHIQDLLQCSYGTASKVVAQFVDLGILVETSGKARHRCFSYLPYLSLFELA